VLDLPSRASSDANSWVANVLSRQLWLARSAERLGAQTIADKLDSVASNGDIVAIRLPPGRHDLRSRRVKMYGRLGDDQVASAFADGGWNGFERPLPSVLRVAVAALDGAFFDVGANSGFYSLVAAQVSRRRVVAFEPLPAALERLARNLDLNRLAGRVEVVPAAVGDHDGEAKLYVPESSGVLETSASMDASFKERHAEVLRVQLRSLDSYRRQLGGIPVGVVKIDVEGFEHVVLAGADELLAEARPLVFVEVLPHCEVGALEERCRAHHYVDARLGPREMVISDRITFDEASWNHALVPEERVGDLAAMGRRAGLAVIRP
jgi:FkbM family methyltransferase